MHVLVVDPTGKHILTAAEDPSPYDVALSNQRTFTALLFA